MDEHSEQKLSVGHRMASGGVPGSDQNWIYSENYEIFLDCAEVHANQHDVARILM